MSSKGLPHYRNSSAAMNLEEPVFDAYFLVQITGPSGLDFPDLVLENLTKVGGIDTGKAFPSSQTQSFKGAKRTYVGGKVPEQFQDIDLSFEVNLNDSNQMYVYNTLVAWCNLAYNPATGKMGMKKNYAGKSMIISQYNADGEVFRQLKFQHVIPMTRVQGPNNFDFESDGIFRVDGWKVRADLYDEITT